MSVGKKGDFDHFESFFTAFGVPQRSSESNVAH